MSDIPSTRTIKLSETPRTDAHLAHLNLPDGRKIGIPNETVALLRDLEHELRALTMAFDAYRSVPSSTDAQNPEYRMVRVDVLAWLHGETPHPETGQWFERPEGEGAYWWRSKLRAATVPLYAVSAR